MLETARSILKRDPAAHSLLEVVLTYPGIRALFWYRIAHYLSSHHLYTLAGLLSQHATKTTGISIAPAAKLGRRIFIDHGVGVVIGETAVIEDDVTLLHGVTLGSRYATDEKKRHPHIKRGAFIGANAQILGSLEVGEFSKIGAGAVVLEDVAPKKTVVGTPAKAVHQSQSKVFSIAPDKQVKKLENS